MQSIPINNIKRDIKREKNSYVYLHIKTQNDF